MSAGQQVIRTAANSIIGHQYQNTDMSIWLPRNPALCKAFIRQEIEVTDTSGMPFAPGSNPRFIASKDVDYVADLSFRYVLSAIPVANWNGGATFARFLDFPGVQCWEELQLQSGTQRLQIVLPEEIMIYIHFMLDDTDRRNVFLQVGQGSPAQRSARALANQEVTCPLYTLLGFRLHGDPGQGMFVRGLNDYLTLRARMRPVERVIETDGTVPTAIAGGFYQSGVMAMTGYHINNDERDRLVDTYTSAPYPIHFDDQQYSSEMRIPATTALSGGVQTFRLLNINQPVTALFVIMRWADDLNRKLGEANGSRGFNPTK